MTNQIETAIDVTNAKYDEDLEQTVTEDGQVIHWDLCDGISSSLISDAAEKLDDWQWEEIQRLREDRNFWAAPVHNGGGKWKVEFGGKMIARRTRSGRAFAMGDREFTSSKTICPDRYVVRNPGNTSWSKHDRLEDALEGARRLKDHIPGKRVVIQDRGKGKAWYLQGGDLGEEYRC